MNIDLFRILFIKINLSQRSDEVNAEMKVKILIL